jgi:hypothetical protein
MESSCRGRKTASKAGSQSLRSLRKPICGAGRLRLGRRKQGVVASELRVARVLPYRVPQADALAPAEPIECIS